MNIQLHPSPNGVNQTPVKRKKLSVTVSNLLAERDYRGLPCWVRAPVRGVEHYSSVSRPKLYDLAGKGLIRSASLREPGQIKGTRLFDLQSILSYIEKNVLNDAPEGEKSTGENSPASA